jgi:hypothetical protein
MNVTITIIDDNVTEIVAERFKLVINQLTSFPFGVTLIIGSQSETHVEILSNDEGMLP